MCGVYSLKCTMQTEQKTEMNFKSIRIRLSLNRVLQLQVPQTDLSLSGVAMHRMEIALVYLHKCIMWTVPQREMNFKSIPTRPAFK